MIGQLWELREQPYRFVSFFFLLHLGYYKSVSSETSIAAVLSAD